MRRSPGRRWCRKGRGVGGVGAGEVVRGEEGEVEAVRVHERVRFVPRAGDAAGGGPGGVGCEVGPQGLAAGGG